jgi:hypothetical protein
MNRKILAGLIGISASAFSSLALASEPETHDGFFFQGQIGGGYLSADGGIEDFDIKFTGGGIAGGLLFGGTPTPGFVIGGGTANLVAIGPSVEAGGLEGEADSDVTLNLTTIGPFATFYPDPHGGLSFTAMVAFAQLSATVEGDQTDDNPTGFSLTGGVGYDFWVAPEWSIGVLGRFTYASVSHEEGGLEESYSVLAPALLASFTYH